MIRHFITIDSIIFVGKITKILLLTINSHASLGHFWRSKLLKFAQRSERVFCDVCRLKKLFSE